MADLQKFVLRAELQGHEADVRGVCGADNGVILSCSRDTSVRMWIPVGVHVYPHETLAGGVVVFCEHFGDFPVPSSQD
jgi:hypothetical protein